MMNEQPTHGRARLTWDAAPKCLAGLAFALLAGTAAQAATADEADPLQSAECKSAQAVNERALEAAAAGSSEARQRLAGARRHVMEACLGRQAGHDTRSGAPSSPVAVPSHAMGARAGQAVPPAVFEPPPPVRIPRSVAITTCDPGGCWDSEGRRLNFMGPVLIGPQGACSVQGGAVQCPQ